MIRLKPDPSSEQLLEDFLARLQRGMKPTRTQLEPVRQAIRAGMARNFAAEADAEMDPWANLSKRTQREREAAGYPKAHPILVRSGGYRASFIDPHDPEHVSQTTLGLIIRLEEGTSDPRADELEAGENPLIPPRPATELGGAAIFSLDEAIADMLDTLLPRD